MFDTQKTKISKRKTCDTTGGAFDVCIQSFRSSATDLRSHVEKQRPDWLPLLLIAGKVRAGKILLQRMVWLGASQSWLRPGLVIPDNG